MDISENAHSVGCTFAYKGGHQTHAIAKWRPRHRLQDFGPEPKIFQLSRRIPTTLGKNSRGENRIGGDRFKIAKEKLRSAWVGECMHTTRVGSVASREGTCAGGMV